MPTKNQGKYKKIQRVDLIIIRTIYKRPKGDLLIFPFMFINKFL